VGGSPVHYGKGAVLKTIIAGSRAITDPAVLDDAISASSFDITEVVSGTAPGVDSLAETWAAQNGIPVKQFPADWNRYGRKAGPIRNTEMAGYAEALIAVWDGRSKGSRNIIQLARRRGLKVFVYLDGDTWEAKEPVQPILCAA